MTLISKLIRFFTKIFEDTGFKFYCRACCTCTWGGGGGEEGVDRLTLCRCSVRCMQVNLCKLLNTIKLQVIIFESAIFLSIWPVKSAQRKWRINNEKSAILPESSSSRHIFQILPYCGWDFTFLLGLSITYTWLKQLVKLTACYSSRQQTCV